MWTRRIAEPGKQFRDLKYKLLGIQMPRPRLYVEDADRPWTEADTLHYLRQTRTLAQSIITDLTDMTDMSQAPLPMPTIRGAMAKLDPTLVQYSKHGLPTVEPPHTVLSVLRALVSFEYGPLEHQNVARWIYSLLAPNHLRAHMTSEAYNLLIGFSLRANDIQLAGHILEIMKSQHVLPDRTSLHLFLAFNARSIAANPYHRPMMGHPLINTQLCIRKMKALGIKADGLTWNLVMQCMPFGFGKSFLVEEMDKRGIPLEDTSKRTLFETILNDQRDFDTTRLAGSLDARDPVIFRLIVDNLLQQKSADNANVTRALAILRNAPHDRSPQMLHVFLSRFAARKHLDWQFGVLAHFEDTPWDSWTWEHLLEGASFTFDTEAKPVVLGTLLKQAEREHVPLTVRSRYLARRASKLALRDIGAQRWHELRQGLKWAQDMRPAQPDLLAAIGFGAGPGLPSEPARLDASRFAALPRTDTQARRLELSSLLSS